MNPEDTFPFVVSIVGTFTSCLLQLSPYGVMREIIATKCVGAYRPDPFILGVIFGLINGTYSIVSSQLVSAISCGIGLTLFSIYLFIYLSYSPQKQVDIRKSMLWIVTCLSIAGVGPLIFSLVDLSSSGHDWTESHGGLFSIINVWLGVAATVSIVLMFSGQLTNMKDVVDRKDARSISLMMALGSLFCSSTWLLYSSLIVNPYYIISNGLGVVSGIIQLSLKRMYTKEPEVAHAVDPAVKHPEAHNASTVTTATGIGLP